MKNKEKIININQHYFNNLLDVNNMVFSMFIKLIMR